ncbi:MAG: quinolinate synthase NadA [candidate division Zixibacteria bacterium]|nr:quinolinate synthase NadA [candidate division Zixibacteria bacterium]
MNFTLPPQYREAGVGELCDRIRAVRKATGKKLCILTHHYQRPEVVVFGDFVGDSFELARQAASQKGVEVTVFCGVHFMAEAADIVKTGRQRVFMPHPLAGCPMADMADMEDVNRAWKYLESLKLADRTVPVSYMNSTAALKAFTGARGGLICTSANAVKAFRYGFENKEKIFFFPDENLGANSGRKLGLRPDEIALWDFRLDRGGLTRAQIEKARLLLWKGHCHVHTNFKPGHIERIRAQYPDVKVIVHPECLPEVVDLADGDGSTRYIVDYCAKAPAGTTIAIGTEINLVKRMALAYPDKTVVPLSGEKTPICFNMYRINLNNLAYCLENYESMPPVTVEDSVRKDALTALEKMLTLD